MDELPLLVESVHASNNAERNRQKCGKPLSRKSSKSKKKRWNPIDARALQRPGDPGDTSLCFRLEPLDSQRNLQARTESASSCASFHLSEPLPRAISTPCARWTKDSTQDFAGLALAEKCQDYALQRKLCTPEVPMTRPLRRQRKGVRSANSCPTVNISLSNTYLTCI